MKSAVLTAVAMLAAAPLAASADEFWYVGAGAMESDLGFDILDDSASGWKIFGGYRFTRRIAAEVGYLDTGDAEETIEGTDVSIGAKGTHVSVVASFPIGETFALHARAGLISWEAELTLSDEFGSLTSEADGQDLYWGAGGSFNIGETWSLRLEYEVPEIEDVDVSAISLSVLYRF